MWSDLYTISHSVCFCFDQDSPIPNLSKTPCNDKYGLSQSRKFEYAFSTYISNAIYCS